jgi:hypothetical protein
MKSAAERSDAPYKARAQEVFATHPEAAVYLFGHTHHAFLEREPDGRVIANLGTWLKILHRVPVRFGYLPGVFYPSFRLNYFRLHEEERGLVIGYVEVAKQPEKERRSSSGCSPRRKVPPPP